MTDRLPDEMFIENSTLPEQLAAGNASPQPGIIVAGDPPSERVKRSPKRVLVFVAVLASVAATAVVIAVFFMALTAESSSTPSAEPSPATAADNDYVPPVSAESVYDKYIAMSEDESIFLIIPRTDEGWDYFRAFMYKITDYKVAESIGGPLDRETTEEMLALEARFLALEDLELTVDITRTDGTHFVHDGSPPSGALSSVEPVPSEPAAP